MTKKHSKRFNEVFKKVNRDKVFSVAESSVLVKEFATTKFDETVDLCLNLSVDPRHADQNVRGAIALPHGLGKKMRVVVFARGEKIREAEESGADFVGGDDLAQKILGGWLEFDAAIATPDMMAVVGKLGKILAPKGLMPNPKVGTVTMDLKNAIKEVKAGRVEFRVNKAGIVQVPVAKVSFTPEQISDNTMALVDAILKAKPSAAKGAYIKSAFMASTMGPSLKLDTALFQN